MAIFSLVARGRVLSGGSSQPSSPLGSTASSDVTVRIDDAVSVGSGIFSDNEDVDGADMMAFSADEDVDEAGTSAAAAVAAVTADIDVVDVAIGDIANQTAVFGMDFLPGMVRSDRPMGAATSIVPRGDGTDREGSVPSVGHANPTAGAATNFLSTVVVLTPLMGAGLRIPSRSRALGAYGARDVAAGFDANRPAGSAMDFLPMSMGPIQPISGRLRTASESSVGDQELEADSAADSEAGAAAAQACEGALEAGEQGIQVGESTNHGMLYSTYYDDLCAQGDEDDEDLDAFEDAVAYDTPAHAPAALSPARAAVVAFVPAVAEVQIPVLECSRAETRRSPAQIFPDLGSVLTAAAYVAGAAIAAPDKSRAADISSARAREAGIFPVPDRSPTATRQSAGEIFKILEPARAATTGPTPTEIFSSRATVADVGAGSMDVAMEDVPSAGHTISSQARDTAAGSTDVVMDDVPSADNFFFAPGLCHDRRYHRRHCYRR